LVKRKERLGYSHKRTAQEDGQGWVHIKAIGSQKDEQKMKVLSSPLDHTNPAQLSKAAE